MILLLDAGNTRIKWVVRGPQGEVARGRRSGADVAELAADWCELPLTGALLACVAGAGVRTGLAAILDGRGVPVRWLEPALAEHGLHNHYLPPESLGVDRYAALVGAHRRWSRDCVVVGLGTALTVDVLSADGQFLGGCIAPGPELMLAALAQGTARLGTVDLDSPEGQASATEDPPRDTASAMRGGILLALLGVVRGMEERLIEWRRIQGVLEDVASPVVLILHGGGSGRLRPFLEGEVRVVDDLVLEGLAWIARDLGYAV